MRAFMTCHCLWMGFLSGTLFPLFASTPGYTTITVRTNGPGSISPNYQGRQLKVGSWLFPTVRPAPGCIFAGWTSTEGNGLAGSAFTVEPGLELEAHFLPNPFPALAGQYAGLFSPSNGPAHATSGCLSLKVSGNGTELRMRGFIGGRSYSLNGLPFGPIETNDIILGWQYAASVLAGGGVFGLENVRQLYEASVPVVFSATNGVLQGTLDNGGYSVRHPTPPTWVAEILAYRSEFDARSNPAPQAGGYTVVFPPNAGLGQVAGYGYASVRVGADGMITLSGALADGAPIAQNTTLSPGGRWPFYAPLYQGKGSVLGWLELVEANGFVPTGFLLWTRPATATPVAAGGFTNEVSLLASPFLPPAAGTPGLPFTRGAVVLAGGGLAQALSLPFVVQPNGALLSVGVNRLTLTFNRASGTFHGNFKHPATGRANLFQGAWLPNQNGGYGYFVSATGSSGSVYLGPR